MINYRVVYEKAKTSYSTNVRDIPNVIATGKTKPTVEKNIFGAFQFHIEGVKAEKLSLPKSQANSEILVFAV